MKKGKIIIFIIILLLIGIFINNRLYSNVLTLGDIFRKLGFEIDKVSDFIINKNILREGGGHTFWTIVAKKKEQVIKIEVIKDIDSESARKYISEKIYVISSLYKRIPSPYPGMISKTIECPDKFIIGENP